MYQQQLIAIWNILHMTLKWTYNYISVSFVLQNTDLSSRVSYLDTCECTPRCSFNGKIFNEGQTWSPDMCTVCQCQVCHFYIYRIMYLPVCALLHHRLIEYSIYIALVPYGSEFSMLYINTTQKYKWENENVIILWSERTLDAQIGPFSLLLFFSQSNIVLYSKRCCLNYTAGWTTSMRICFFIITLLPVTDMIIIAVSSDWLFEASVLVEEGMLLIFWKYFLQTVCNEVALRTQVLFVLFKQNGRPRCSKRLDVPSCICE